MKAGSVLNVVCVSVLLGLAEVAEPARPEYAPNEVIVKFRDSVADSLEKQLEAKQPADGLRLSGRLDALNARYQVRGIRAVFKDFKKHRRRIEALAINDIRLLTKQEKHILRRLKRAPTGAKVPDLSRIYKLELGLRPGQSLAEAVAAYDSDADVEYADLNYVVSIDLTPDDPYYPIQWPLHNIGQMYPESGDYNPPPGTPDRDIDAPEAWNIATGSSNVVVAVVDTGVDYYHRDLQANVWVNSDEIAGNGVDDDGNGYVDDIYGYDFCTLEHEPDSDPIDDHGHGTHCSGIIAAEGNNGLDITGVCWNAKIMALKFINREGTGSTVDAVSCFYYAVENGADVTSNSWGGAGYSQTMQEAIDYAHSQGVVMVASAGNSNSGALYFPAGYERMISVAATDSRDQRAPFSNYGDWVDIAAPGVDVLSLLANGTSLGRSYSRYATIASGTSMSCPHVAGVYALALSALPHWGVDLITGQVKHTADSLSDNRLGSGRVNAFNALTMSPGTILIYKDYVVDDSPGNDNGRVEPGETFYLDVRIRSDWGPTSNVCASLSSDSPWVQVIDGNSLYGAMSPQEEKFALEPFVIEADPYGPLESAIPFALTISADGDYTENRTFYVYPKKEWVHEGLRLDGPKLRDVEIDSQGVLYACAGMCFVERVPREQDGLYKGTRGLDGAVSWRRLGPAEGLPGMYSAFNCAPPSNGVVYAYVGLEDFDDLTQECIYKSTDFGNTWVCILDLSTLLRRQTYPNKIFSPLSDPDKLYLCTLLSGWGYGSLYATFDGGRTWETLHRFEKPAKDFAMDRQDPNVMRGCGYSEDVPFHFVSTDAGHSWSYMALPSFSGRATAIKPVGNKIYMRVGGRICKSFDGGETWAQFDSIATPKLIDVRNSEILYDCRGAYGPYKSFDGGRSFVPINFGSYPRSGFSITQERSYPYTIYVADLHSGIYSYDAKPDIPVPALEVLPCEIQFLALLDRGNPDSQVLLIRNSGDGTLNWEIGPPNDCPWLDVAPLDGISTVEVDEVVLSADITGLPVADYNCVLTVWADGAVYNPRLVNVNLHLQGPILQPGPVEFEFRASKENPIPPDQTLSISNSGGGTLNWEIGFPNDCNWLEVHPTAGQSTTHVSEVTLSVDANGLDYGAYACQLIVSDPNADNSPQTVQVHLHVLRPQLCVEPNGFRFWVHNEGPNPPDQILCIRNCGEDTLAWEIAKDCAWVQVSPASGTSTGEFDNVIVSVDAAGLPHGEHACVLTISAADGLDSPQIVGVNLVVNTISEVPTEDYPTIQAAIDAALNGDVVSVADGVYTGQGNRDIDFNGKAITVCSQNGPANCVIDCQGTDADPHRGFNFHSGEIASSVVEGFTITGGYASLGGAMNIGDSSPEVVNCIFSGNAALWGGAIEIADSSARIINCIFRDNAAWEGGAIENQFGSPHVANCTFYANIADLSGGGVYSYESSATVTDSIFWADLPQAIYVDGGSTAVSYCDLQGGYLGQGNIDTDPCFVDAAEGDYHLLPGSAAIDAGDPSSDWINEPWPNGFRVNMGAYGNTSEATRSVADFEDLGVLACYWLTDEPLVDIAPEPDGDGVANFLDFSVFADYWHWRP